MKTKTLTYYLINWIVILILFISPSIKADNKKYYFDNADVMLEEARLCDKYIRENYLWFISQVHLIDANYNKKLINEAVSNTQNIMFSDYKANFLKCASNFNYVGNINYFLETDISLEYLLTSISVAKEKDI